MAPETFPQFPLLPPELRLQIYLLATPPRFIHIREHLLSDYNTFHLNWTNNPIPPDFKLHPSLTYFAHEWRHTIPLRTTQTTLTSHGFTTTKPVPQSWTPSKSCPEIPLHSLLDEPEIAWELSKESYLYSKAPIPALLHTTTDSRRLLQNYGYELAFSTRTNGPRTWICCKHDVVYLTRNLDVGMGSAGITREERGLGLFMPDDLKCVKRLALENVDSTLGRDWGHDRDRVARVLRVFGGVEELFLVERNLNDWMEVGDEWDIDGAWSKEDGERRMREWGCAEGRLWGWVECEEADVLGKEGLVNNWRQFYFSRENICCRLVDYKRENGGDGSGFFQCLEQHFEQILKNERDKVGGEEGMTLWRIPNIKIVHVGTMGKMERLFEMRREYWRAAEEK
ncbi:hypothetical protein BKA65DRAFT_557327 [Rhexocercosporidium sp. MPI-PUGE-AT-0058]|nr:hypothetical protein BKA65DRAFT_557327 [Rhexocercosporidium sp. MPI-PUGE-AT-0058]